MIHTTRKRSLTAAVATLAALGTLAACGGESDSGGDGSSDAAAVKVMLITPLTGPVPPLKENEAVAKAAAEWINDNGGLGGRQMELIVCDDATDPNKTAACGRTAVDEGVVAVIGQTYNGAQLLPVLNPAKIAYLPNSGLSAADTTDSDSFPFTAGSITATGLGLAAGKSCESSALLHSDFPGAEALKGQFDTGLAPAGKEVDKEVTYPQTNQDFAAQIAEAFEDDADCLFLPVSPTAMTPILTAIKNSGHSATIFTLQGNLLPETLAEFSDQLEGAIGASYIADFQSDAFADMRAALEGADTSLNYQGNQPQSTWVAVQIIREIASSVKGDLTGETFFDALSSAASVDTHGMVSDQPLDFSTEWDVKNQNRVFNRSVTFFKVTDGEVASIDNTFYDLSPLFAGGSVELGF